MFYLCAGSTSQYAYVGICIWDYIRYLDLQLQLFNPPSPLAAPPSPTKILHPINHSSSHTHPIKCIWVYHRVLYISYTPQITFLTHPYSFMLVLILHIWQIFCCISVNIMGGRWMRWMMDFCANINSPLPLPPIFPPRFGGWELFNEWLKYTHTPFWCIAGMYV